MNERETALCLFAESLTLNPSDFDELRMVDNLKAAGFSDAAILDATLVIAYFNFVNNSEKIIIMIDEAHRTQYGMLGANLNKSLPNATKIAFTGTPVDRTERTFGDYIDKYSIRQAVDDEVTVEIIYEGRTHDAKVTDPEAMSKRFEDVFSAVSKDTRQQILGRYTWKAYLEAEETVSRRGKRPCVWVVTGIGQKRLVS